MTKEQYMKAGKRRVSILYNDVLYERILEVVVQFTDATESAVLQTAAIHRNDARTRVLLRLGDKNGARSTTLAPPEKVEVDPEIKVLFPGEFD